jgi:hypothetical protein
LNSTGSVVAEYTLIQMARADPRATVEQAARELLRVLAGLPTLRVADADGRLGGGVAGEEAGGEGPHLA